MELKHQAVSARKWRAAIRQIRRHFPPTLPPVLFLTDPQRVTDPVEAIACLPQGSGVIYRHFGSPDRAEVAAQLADLCTARQFFLLIAADPKLALSVGAFGVHWPEARLPEAQRWKGQFAMQTASAHCRGAIWRAQRAGMDAALVSKVHPSQSASPGNPMGAIRFRQLARPTDLPVYALGGVNAGNAGRTASSGGIAAVESLLI